jgi:hypothetical protein
VFIICSTLISLSFTPKPHINTSISSRFSSTVSADPCYYLAYIISLHELTQKTEYAMIKTGRKGMSKENQRIRNECTPPEANIRCFPPSHLFYSCTRSCKITLLFNSTMRKKIGKICCKDMAMLETAGIINHSPPPQYFQPSSTQRSLLQHLHLTLYHSHHSLPPQPVISRE